eukprot:CAMPEP_0181188264 /NCGR_PEP_ID=MMETSP1096-20121128/11018_1 /TAXON_ID=156174 ORGANISM="Chrysochromulina ericina, Strain CCMP281" /NCGR_SAMPLE_ID=MMETSP1096 /ASSEMBLY_ACC=CAM_ASM_000453 /LENGTH=39 /DNA_ID= /DNA_START= /DNA_END= /DNA_ORIENTATION=
MPFDTAHLLQQIGEHAPKLCDPDEGNGMLCVGMCTERVE